uniref:Interleukin 17C n=1 Tax=Sciurus vulgaris TaxID=55149 RepID=A0A8D2JJP7_SCIVU
FVTFLRGWISATVLLTPSYGATCFKQKFLKDGFPNGPEFQKRKPRWEQALPVALVSSLEAEGYNETTPRPSCPTLKEGEALSPLTHERSISPWRYRIDTDENRYPKKLAFAECLCRGCISTRTGQETAALSSVRLHQSLLVVKRKPCSTDGSNKTDGFQFRRENIRVPVGCTCIKKQK